MAVKLSVPPAVRMPDAFALEFVAPLPPLAPLMPLPPLPPMVVATTVTSAPPDELPPARAELVAPVPPFDPAPEPMPPLPPMAVALAFTASGPALLASAEALANAPPLPLILTPVGLPAPAPPWALAAAVTAHQAGGGGSSGRQGRGRRRAVVGAADGVGGGVDVAVGGEADIGIGLTTATDVAPKAAAWAPPAPPVALLVPLRIAWPFWLRVKSDVALPPLPLLPLLIAAPPAAGGRLGQIENARGRATDRVGGDLDNAATAAAAESAAAGSAGFAGCDIDGSRAAGRAVGRR